MAVSLNVLRPTPVPPPQDDGTERRNRARKPIRDQERGILWLKLAQPSTTGVQMFVEVPTDRLAILRTNHERS